MKVTVSDKNNKLTSKTSTTSIILQSLTSLNRNGKTVCFLCTIFGENGTCFSRRLNYTKSNAALYCKNVIYTANRLILNSVIDLYSYRCYGNFIERMFNTSQPMNRLFCSSTTRLPPGHCLPCKKNIVHDWDESEAAKTLC